MDFSFNSLLLLYKKCNLKIYVYATGESKLRLEKLLREKNIHHEIISNLQDLSRSTEQLIFVDDDFWLSYSSYDIPTCWNIFGDTVGVRVLQGKSFKWNGSKVLRSLEYSNETFHLMDKSSEISQLLLSLNAKLTGMPDDDLLDAPLLVWFVVWEKVQDVKRTISLLKLRVVNSYRVLGCNFLHELKNGTIPTYPGEFPSDVLEGLSIFFTQTSNQNEMKNEVKRLGGKLQETFTEGCIVLLEPDNLLPHELVLIDPTKCVILLSQWLEEAVSYNNALPSYKCYQQNGIPCPHPSKCPSMIKKSTLGSNSSQTSYGGSSHNSLQGGSQTDNAVGAIMREGCIVGTKTYEMAARTFGCDIRDIELLTYQTSDDTPFLEFLSMTRTLKFIMDELLAVGLDRREPTFLFNAKYPLREKSLDTIKLNPFYGTKVGAKSGVISTFPQTSNKTDVVLAGKWVGSEKDCISWIKQATSLVIGVLENFGLAAACVKSNSENDICEIIASRGYDYAPDKFMTFRFDESDKSDQLKCITFHVTTENTDVLRNSTLPSKVAHPMAYVFCGDKCICDLVLDYQESMTIGKSPMHSIFFVHDHSKLVELGTPLILRANIDGFGYWMRSNWKVGRVPQLTYEIIAQLLTEYDQVLKNERFKFPKLCDRHFKKLQEKTVDAKKYDFFYDDPNLCNFCQNTGFLVWAEEEYINDLEFNV